MRGSRGESESCEDLEGSRNHALIERGVRIMRWSRGESESCADREGGQKEEGSGNLQENQSSSVYIVKLLNICIGPPFPRPWKTFLDLCMEAISFCKKVSHLRMLIHILSRFFSGLHRKDPKSWDLHLLRSKTICSSVNNMIYKCMLLLCPSDLLVWMKLEHISY